MKKRTLKKFGAWLVVAAMLLSMVGTVSVSAATQSEAYEANVPSTVTEVGDNIITGSVAAANTYMLAFLGINITSTESCGTMAQLIFGSEWNQEPDPYIANYYYNTANEIDSDSWEGEYMLMNSAKSGPTGGVSNTSTQSITVNGVTKDCNPVFFYEPDVLFGASTSSYSTGLEYYQETVNSDYNPLQIGGWGTGTGSYAQSTGSFADNAAMANGVYYDAVAIQAYLDSIGSDKTGRYGNIVDAAETYCDFAMGIHYYYQSLVADGTIEPVNYAGGLTDNGDGTYTLSAGSGRMAQYADGMGNLVTGTYSSIEELAEAVDVIVSYSGDLSDDLEAAGIKLLTSLPTVVYGTTMQSADNILGVPYFFAFFYEDQLAEAGITLTVADVTAYFVYHIYHIKAEYVQDAVTVMMSNLSVDDTVNSTYNDTVTEMIAAGETYYLSLGDEADATWAAVDLADQEFTYTENEDGTYSVTGSTCIVANGVNGHDYDDGTVTVAATATQPGVMTYTCTICGDSYTEVIDPLLDVVISVSDDVDADYADIAQTIAESIDINADLADAIETAAEALVPATDSETVLTALQTAVEAEGKTWAVADDGTVTVDDETASISTSYAVTLNIDVTACGDTGVTVTITPLIQVSATATVTSSSSSQGGQGGGGMGGPGGGSSSTTYDATLIEDAELDVSGTFFVTIPLDDLIDPDTTENIVDILSANIDGEVSGYGYGGGSISLTVSSLPATLAVSITADTTDTGNTGDTGDTGGTGDTGDTGDTGGTETTYDVEFTWASNRGAYSCTATFTNTADASDTQTVDCTVDDGVVTTAATCTEDGVLAYTATATFNGETYANNYYVAISATGHTEDESTETIITAATCTEAGQLSYVCSVCGETVYEEIAATGHSYTHTVTTQPTRYTRGVMTYVCDVCGDTYTAEIATTGATFLFDDVDADEYYATAVYWAYDLGVTNGTTETTFSPTEGCTRAQFATFLYRMAKNTGVDVSYNVSNPFSDVTNSGADAVYYDAIMWAYANDITNGTTLTTFSPNDTITRAQAVTMLYRYATMMNGGTAPTVSTSNIFSDVTNSGADAVYYDAILWAVEYGITNGTSDTAFSPSDTCERDMMVTFLYRYQVEPLTSES